MAGSVLKNRTAGVHSCDLGKSLAKGGMPHLILEFSENLGTEEDLAPLLEELHLEVGRAETVDIESLKSRLYPHSIYRVGKDTSVRAFIHLTLRILPGRTEEWKKTLGAKLHAMMVRGIAPLVPSGVRCSTTLEMVLMDDRSYIKN